ncbi:MAG: ABC transporter substrate-binding protein [Lawsonibacter sp.]|nr:ABC transporter substrate-binding protein [Lawsonibacter sp.]
MKRTLSVFLTAALALSLLAGCGPKTPAGTSSSAPGTSSSQPEDSSQPGSSSQPGDTSAASGPTPRLMVLSGPTGVGAAKLMANADDGFPSAIVEVVTDNTQVQTALANKDVDIAAIATNAAAALYAKTDGGIQVLAVNTLGVLYILEKGDTVHAMADLAGKTLYAPSNTKGANPEHILNHLLQGSGVDPSEVNIEWLTPQEITVKMTSSDAGLCMLPIPAATALLVKDSGIREAISLSDAWEDLEDSPLPMGCVVARTEYIKENPQEVEAFLSAYEKSIDYISDPANSADASALVAKYEFAPNDKVAAKAIPQCSLTFVTGSEMKAMLEDYYTVLFQAEPKSIGGGLPFDSFYYGVG